MTEDEQMIAGIYEGIMSIFDEDSNNLYHMEFDELKKDATPFITNVVKAANLVFSEITQSPQNNLDFTYIANQLIVQDLMEQQEQESKNEWN